MIISHRDFSLVQLSGQYFWFKVAHLTFSCCAVNLSHKHVLHGTSMVYCLLHHFSVFFLLIDKFIIFITYVPDYPTMSFFLNHICSSHIMSSFMQAAPDQLKLMGPVILSGILRSLDGSSSTEAGICSIFLYILISLSFLLIKNKNQWHDHHATCSLLMEIIAKLFIFLQTP